MALYRFLFAPALLAVAVALGSGPPAPPPSAPAAPAAASAAIAPAPTGPVMPVALHGQPAAGPIRAR